MGNKPITAKQHFVPQFYLRNFTNDKNELYIYDAENRKEMKPRGAGGVCQEQFFYAIETRKSDDISQDIEEYFNRHIEDPLSKEISLIIKKIENDEQIFDTEKYTLAVFMNSMWLRNPMMRKQINRMEESMFKWISKNRFSHPGIGAELDEYEKQEGLNLSQEEREKFKNMVMNEEYKVTFSNRSHLRFMLESEHIRGFANLFYGQQWTIHISRCDRKFVTSDSPVTTIFPERKTFYGPTFLERTHLFPLTPNILIEATYPRKVTGKKIKRKTYFKGDEAIINEFNLKMASFTGKYIYCSRQEEIDWFKNHAKKIEKLQNTTLEKMVKLFALQNE